MCSVVEVEAAVPRHRFTAWPVGYKYSGLPRVKNQRKQYITFSITSTPPLSDRLPHFRMDRQTFYNGPLSSSFPIQKSQFGTAPYCSLPRDFPSSFPSGPVKHPLLPQSPHFRSSFFRTCTPPVRGHGFPLSNTMTEHNGRGECVSSNNEPKLSF